MPRRRKLKTKSERRAEEKRKAKNKDQRGATLAGQIAKSKISREFKKQTSP